MAARVDKADRNGPHLTACDSDTVLLRTVTGSRRRKMKRSHRSKVTVIREGDESICFTEVAKRGVSDCQFSAGIPLIHFRTTSLPLAVTLSRRHEAMGRGGGG